MKLLIVMVWAFFEGSRGLRIEGELVGCERVTCVYEVIFDFLVEKPRSGHMENPEQLN